MSEKESIWKIKPSPDPEKVERLSTEVGIDKVLASLLVDRGIETFAQARKFFRPSLDDLHDPFLMKDMDKAVERLEKAIRSGEKILVYGDYDVDGTTAVALLHSFISKFTSKVDFYIPDRYNEGYGVSEKGIRWAADGGFSLIITVDCGIKAVEKVALAKSLGIDTIICDHHLPDETLPDAVAVLDPKREDDNYPFDDLSGCGVGFKLAQAYAATHGVGFEELKELLDLLVVSIASDLVEMRGENRILAHYGLKRLNESPRYGLIAMIELSGLEQGHINVDDIVFKIGPRINAAGRMESGRLAVELLTATDKVSAMKTGQKINENNNERKSIDREITQEALEMVRSGNALASNGATIVYNPNWNKGVVGIVASRLVEEFYKPTVVLTKSIGGFVTGSARSVTGFDLYDAIEHCADLLENFGGHVYAAGLTLKEENLKEFASRLDSYVEGRITYEQTTPQIDIDARIDLSQITPKFFRILKQFQPFGPGNHNPVFETDSVCDKGNGRKVGAGGLHLKLDLIQEDYSGGMPSIAFNQADKFAYIAQGNPFDVCYCIVENYYRGNSSLQLRIKDIKEREEII